MRLPTRPRSLRNRLNIVPCGALAQACESVIGTLRGALCIMRMVLPLGMACEASNSPRTVRHVTLSRASACTRECQMAHRLGGGWVGHSFVVQKLLSIMCFQRQSCIEALPKGVWLMRNSFLCLLCLSLVNRFCLLNVVLLILLGWDSLSVSFCFKDTTWLFDFCGRNSQVGSLAGAAHLLNDNAGVLR